MDRKHETPIRINTAVSAVKPKATQAIIATRPCRDMASPVHGFSRFFPAFRRRLLGLQVIDNLDHEVPHVAGQSFAFRAVHFSKHLAVGIVLVPVPLYVRRSFAELFSRIPGNRAPYADKHVENTARGTIEDAAVRTLTGDDPVPLADRRFHNADFIHTIPHAEVGMLSIRHSFYSASRRLATAYARTRPHKCYFR